MHMGLQSKRKDPSQIISKYESTDIIINMSPYVKIKPQKFIFYVFFTQSYTNYITHQKREISVLIGAHFA